MEPGSPWRSFGSPSVSAPGRLEPNSHPGSSPVIPGSRCRPMAVGRRATAAPIGREGKQREDDPDRERRPSGWHDRRRRGARAQRPLSSGARDRGPALTRAHQLRDQRDPAPVGENRRTPSIPGVPQDERSIAGRSRPGAAWTAGAGSRLRRSRDTRAAPARRPCPQHGMVLCPPTDAAPVGRTSEGWVHATSGQGEPDEIDAKEPSSQVTSMPIPRSR